MKPIGKLFEARKEIIDLIPENAILFDESILNDDEWYENTEHNIRFYNLPEIVVHTNKDDEILYYGRVISINNQLIKTYNDQYGLEERNISTISAEELAKIVLFYNIVCDEK